MDDLSKQIKEAKNAYYKEWYRKNKDKHKGYMQKYWEKKAKEQGEKENGRTQNVCENNN